MLAPKVKEGLADALKEIKEAGLYKDEWIILTAQGADIKVKQGEVINFCANNYLGLANHPRLVDAAKEGLDKYGYGMSSVRFICGTQDVHKDLEAEISKFLGTEDTILYSSCFDANGGLFETLLDKECVIISDALNHASIIDGIRLCKAERKVFKHGDMADLEERLKESKDAKRVMIATDGVFSMDGDVAKLDEITALADKYGAMVMVDDCHATGFFGKTGRGTPEFRGVHGKIDVITSTMGKAMGGASGGFTSGRQEIIDTLRQRSRPYLFSNTVAPPIAFAALAAFKMLGETTELRDKLEENTKYFRDQMTANGWDIKPGFHPIVPIMLGEAKLAHDIAKDMLDEGIYVIGFSYPVVPKGEARIRVQVSAAHTKEHLDKAITAFAKIGKKHGVIK
jgi:glycine C-acetyltransferase